MYIDIGNGRFLLKKEVVAVLDATTVTDIDSYDVKTVVIGKKIYYSPVSHKILIKNLLKNSFKESKQ